MIVLLLHGVRTIALRTPGNVCWQGNGCAGSFPALHKPLPAIEFHAMRQVS